MDATIKLSNKLQENWTEGREVASNAAADTAHWNKIDATMKLLEQGKALFRFLILF